MIGMTALLAQLGKSGSNDNKNGSPWRFELDEGTRDTKPVPLGAHTNNIKIFCRVEFLRALRRKDMSPGNALCSFQLLTQK